MNAKEVLDILLTEFKTDKAGLANILNVSRQTIGHLSTGHTRKFSDKLAKKIISKRPDINRDFIIGKSDVIKLDGIGPYMDVEGKDKLSPNEFLEHFFNHREYFEEHPVFKLYRESVFNEGQVSALQEKLDELRNKD